MDFKDLTKGLLFSLSILSILVIIVMQILFEEATTRSEKMHKKLCTQLNISCILHCASYLFMYIKINKSNNPLCHIEGILNIGFVLSTILFTVSISIILYYSFSSSEESYFRKHFSTIARVFSIISWCVPIVYIVTYYINCIMKDGFGSAMKIYQNGTCWLHEQYKGMIIYYMVLMLIGLSVGTLYTILLIIAVFKEIAQSHDYQQMYKITKFLPLFINVVTFAPFIINMVMIEFAKKEDPVFGLICECLECLSGVTFAVGYELNKVSCNKERKSSTFKISFVDLSTEKEFPIIYSTDENVSVVE